MAYTTPKTWAYKETLSSADMNTYISDNITYLKSYKPEASNRQNNTTNNIVTNQKIQTGWGFVIGDGVNDTASESITFPVPFSSIPIISVNVAGYKNSDPTDPGDVSGSNFGQAGILSWGAYPSLTGFEIGISSVNGGVLTNNRRYVYQWIAIG